VAIVLAIGALYLWTATSSPEGRNLDLLQAEAFQHGDAALPVAPPPDLLALDDPYDPAQNGPYRINDASLYKGRYYLYFGPVPAAVFFLPLRVVGIDLTDRWAAPILAFAGYACAAALLLFLIGRFVPRTPTVWRLTSVAALGLGSVVLFMLRRPDVYEVSIASGLFFLMAAILLLVVGTLRDRPSLPLLGLGSLCMGLAAGSRANMALAAPLLIWAWWHALGPRRHWQRATVLKATAVAGGPFVACLLALALYNVVRFGSPTEFGVSYQLGGLNSRELELISLDRLLPGLWFDFLQPPHFGLDFPFITLAPEYPGTLPSQYGVELVAGILPVAPILLALAATPLILRRAKEPRTREMLVLCGLLLGVGLALLLLPVLILQGATERHQVDWAGLMIIVALMAWLWWADRLRSSGWARRTVLGVGATALAYGAVVNLAFGVVGYHDGLRVAHPDTYARLERAFSWVPTLAVKIRGEPALLEVRSFGSNVELQIVSPSAGVVDLRGEFLPNPALPAGSIVSLVVSGSEVRRVPLVQEDTTVPIELSGAGLHDVSIRFELIRLGHVRPPPPGSPGAGLGLVDARVTGWEPR
jgi:hypothetical protein